MSDPWADGDVTEIVWRVKPSEKPGLEIVEDVRNESGKPVRIVVEASGPPNFVFVRPAKDQGPMFLKGLVTGKL